MNAGGPGDEQYQDDLSGGPGYALLDEVAKFAFDDPVAVITGRRDRVGNYTDQLRSMRNYPRGTHTVVDDAGHLQPFEQPDLLRALTRDWLRRCDA